MKSDIPLAIPSEGKVHEIDQLLYESKRRVIMALRDPARSQKHRVRLACHVWVEVENDTIHASSFVVYDPPLDPEWGNEDEPYL